MRCRSPEAAPEVPLHHQPDARPVHLQDDASRHWTSQRRRPLRTPALLQNAFEIYFGHIFFTGRMRRRGERWRRADAS
eukprot:9543842-Heterocapsa_arctica.AAC.1